MFAHPTIDPTAFVAPTATVHGHVTIGALAVVMFGAAIRAELDTITVGEQSNVQDNAVLHCDEGAPLVVGRRVTIGHAAVAHGATIGNHCLVGVGAVVLNGSALGEGAWLAAGSVLTPGRSIEPWTLAAGTPARPVRTLTGDEIRRQDEGIDHYLRFAELYRQRDGG